MKVSNSPTFTHKDDLLLNGSRGVPRSHPRPGGYCITPLGGGTTSDKGRNINSQNELKHSKISSDFYHGITRFSKNFFCQDLLAKEQFFSNPICSNQGILNFSQGLLSHHFYRVGHQQLFKVKD